MTLYELICNGEHPYEDGKPMVGESVRDPKKFRPDLGDALDVFLQKACAPHRDARFATAVEMQDALQKVRATV